MAEEEHLKDIKVRGKWEENHLKLENHIPGNLFVFRAEQTYHD